MQPVAVAPATFAAVAAIDERYLSNSVEMAEVIGGKFWKPYGASSNPATARVASTPAASAASGTGLQAGQDATMFQTRPPIDLADGRLRQLAAALGPAYVRVSGTWTNSVCFHDSDAPASPTAPEAFQGVLTRAQWKGAIDFARAVNATVITSFAIGAGGRDAAGVWTPDQARKLLAFNKAIGGEIAAAEFFNGPTMAEYGAVRRVARSRRPELRLLRRSARPLRAGPAGLDHRDRGRGMRRQPMGGTFLDSLRFLDQRARVAKHGVKVILHNTPAASEYGLLDQSTFAPRPNYWAALL